MLFADTLRAGLAFTIRVVVKDGTCAVINFIEEELQQAERMKVLALLESVAEHGPPRNEGKFRHEGKGLYALKTTGARLYGFFDGQKTLVLTHGFKKRARGGKKVQARERERAERIRELLLAERAGKEGAR